FPFADKAIYELAGKVKGIVMAELNFGQLVGEVRRAANGQCPVKLCAKYDMTIFEPEEIAASVDELIKEVSGS
ncbi:MAG: 2-oxoacid:acceptor oxidoreductase subunit alpha, partial [Selenomonadaceae bacterium]|nr:2-oxoacid:acceptor oxidoreductase subunit alpha [Selenomonadaceae bacterium]